MTHITAMVTPTCQDLIQWKEGKKEKTQQKQKTGPCFSTQVRVTDKTTNKKVQADDKYQRVAVVKPQTHIKALPLPLRKESYFSHLDRPSVSERPLFLG